MSDRKVRLAALAAKAGRSKKAADEVEENDIVQAVELTRARAVLFRNYAPIDERLEPDDENEEPLSKRPRNEETKSALQEALEKAQKEVATIVADGDVTTMGPKKINADLKRDVQEKLDKLERRTQRAIVSLLKERLERDAEADVPELD
jgi:coiled-coil domain-containing protein 12